jgi:hypothetical protein
MSAALVLFTIPLAKGGVLRFGPEDRREARKEEKAVKGWT